LQDFGGDRNAIDILGPAAVSRAGRFSRFHHVRAGAARIWPSGFGPAQSGVYRHRQLFWRVAARSFRLILMSQILISISGGKLSFQLINVAGADVLYGWLNQAVGVFTYGFDWAGDFAPVGQACGLLYRRKIYLKL
jgi:hypothetical protein